LTWNIQYLAGKGYHFFYEGGSDGRPELGEIEKTLSGVVSIILEVDPDIILLQEVDDGAKRTGSRDQLDDILSRLPDDYVCHTSSFYWKAKFVPHPKIMGPVGMKLSVISRYKIEKAIRYQLSLMPQNFLKQLFYLKRCLLEVHLSDNRGHSFVILNTHLSAFAEKTETLRRQVEEITGILKKLDRADIPWILGGDFNLQPHEREIKPLLKRYTSVPSLAEIMNNQAGKWYTHFPNDPKVNEPKSTIDYLFCSHDWQLGRHLVRHDGTLDLSDHLPVVAHFSCTAKGMVPE